MTDLNEKWGTVRFKIFELAIMRRCLDTLELFEMVLNKRGETLEPIGAIKQEQSKLDGILVDYNLRNPWALIRNKKMTIRIGEWKTLQNGLCITIGVQTGIDDGVFPKELLMPDEMFKVVKKIHRRFELFPVRIIAGLKSKGYKIDEEKAKQLIEEYQTHEPRAAIKPIEDTEFIKRAKERYESNYRIQQEFLSTFHARQPAQSVGSGGFCF